jgi:hypothetical protein
MAWHPEIECRAPEDQNSGEALRQRHQELYGRLLEVHAAIDNSGSFLFPAYWVTALVVGSVVWSGWYQRIPGLQGIELSNFWTYAALFTAALFGYGFHSQWSEWWRYRRYRGALRSLAAEAGISRYQLLTRLENDTAVKKALDMIKRDHWE